MISIWEGTITKIWDAIQFCRIIDNLSFWALHCLKPKVTQYLSQWRLRYCPNVPNIYSLLEMDTRTAEIVHQIQDRLSSLGLSPNEDLPALVRQAVVLQEVMRSSTKEAKADSRSKEDMEPPAVPTSSPSPPGDSTLKIPRSSSAGSQQGNNPKINLKEKETLEQDSDSLVGKGEKGVAKPSKPQIAHIPQVISPPRHRTSSPVGPDKGKECIYESSTVLEDTKGEHSSIFLLSCNGNGLISSPAISANVLSDKKQTSSFQSPNVLEADGRSNNKVSFSNPHQNKTSSAEEGQAPLPKPPKEPEDVTLNLVQRALRSMASRVENGHVLSLAEQKRRKSKLRLKVEKPPNISKPSDSLPRNDLSKKNSSDQTPSSPGPFVSETFSLSFQPMPWLDLDMAGPGIETRHRHGPYPTLGIGILEYDVYREKTDLLSVLLRRMHVAQQLVVTESRPPPRAPASPLKVKIPWKDKYIMVRLPPVGPTSSRIKKRSYSSEQGQRWKV